MRLRQAVQIVILSFFQVFCVHATPVISKIVNNSDCGYLILKHSDKSSCSLSGKHVVIAPGQTFNQDFLLEASPQPGKASLVLRPIYYLDPKTDPKTKISLVNEGYHFVPSALDDAFALWKKGKGKSWGKITSGSQWMDQWVGGDIEIFPHETEISGYRQNLSRVRGKNGVNDDVITLSFGNGIFSKLFLELHINQLQRKTVRVKLVPLHGEGGLCHEMINENGVVEGKVEKL